MTDTNQTTDHDFDAAFSEYAGSDPVDVPDAQPAADTPQDEPPAEAATAPPADDPFAWVPHDKRDLIDTLQRERDDYAHRARSDAGRLGAMTRRINELQAALQTSAATQQRAPSESTGEAEPNTSSPMDEVRETFPELAAAIEAERAARQEEIARLRREASAPYEAMQREQYLASQYAALEAAHPNWQQTVQSPDFATWLSEQPPAVQRIVESDDAQEASWMLDRFQRDNQAVKTDQTAARQSVAAARRERLAQSVGVPARGVATGSGAPDDFDSAFDYFARKK